MAIELQLKNAEGLLSRKDGERFILASASPRRSELLKELVKEFEVIPSNINENQLNGESPSQFASRQAREKAEAVIRLLSSLEPFSNWVLAADTIVVREGHILGKPADIAEAKWMLTQLQDRKHEVITGICLLNPGKSICTVEAVRTQVWMKRVTEKQIDQYIVTDEPYDKAGGYAIQGLARQFIDKIEGSYTNVIGLPMERLSEIFKEHGV